jgi:hypothetical protein
MGEQQIADEQAKGADQQQGGQYAAGAAFVKFGYASQPLKITFKLQ